jgi:hypothetical protein
MTIRPAKSNSDAGKLTLMRADASFASRNSGELERLIERAATATDPQAAEKRRKGAERSAGGELAGCRYFTHQLVVGFTLRTKWLSQTDANKT